jgi:hypothetical protein
VIDLRAIEAVLICFEYARARDRRSVDRLRRSLGVVDDASRTPEDEYRAFPVPRSARFAGFNIRKGVHPIVPIMLGDAKVAQEMARRMLDEGVYVIGFSFPVVPKGHVYSRPDFRVRAIRSSRWIERSPHS